MRMTKCRYVSDLGVSCRKLAQAPDHYCSDHIEHEAEYIAGRNKWQASNRAAYQKKYNNTQRLRDEVKQEQDKFYRTKAWKHARLLKLQQDYYLCQYCLAHGRTSKGNTVDHIIPYEFDSSKKLDSDNLATICRTCHYAKTKWERDYYGTGAGNQLNEVAAVPVISLLPDFWGSSKTQ